MLRILLALSLFTQLTLFALEQNELKAVFLERFTRFIEWPSAQVTHQGDFTICVVNDQAFTKTLNHIYSNKTIKNRQVSVLSIQENSPKKGCSLLYIGKNTRTVTKLVKEAKQYHLLTISHHKGFASQGVMINFYLDQQRMRYEINNQTAKQSDLNISYLLLKSARLIPSDEHL